MTLIDRFLTGEYQVTRTLRGTYIKGRYEPGPEETIFVNGSLQPTTSRELKLPEEGNRLRQYFKFYSDCPIVTDGTQKLSDSDRVIINGERYRAMGVTHWQNVDLEYFVTVLAREPEQ